MLKKCLMIAAFMAPMASLADSTCQGVIEYLAVGRGSTVLVKGPGGLPATYLCSLSVKQNNVDPEACRAIYSTLLAAQAQQKPVRITFNPNIASCSDVASWGWAVGFNWVIVD